MAKSIAEVWDAKLDYVESTYGNSVLDLQTNKVDMALPSTRRRSGAVDRLHQPMIIHPFGCVARQGFNPVTWATSTSPRCASRSISAR